MITLSWNCREVGLPSNFQFLTDVVRHEKPDFIFLCETIEKKNKMEWIQTKLGFEGLITVDPQGMSGGLALLWKEGNNAHLLGYSKNHIDLEVVVSGMQPWRLTGLYGEPDRSQRRKTWDLLRHLARDLNLSWCVIGDLNNVISQNDKRGGASYPRWLIEDFNEALSDMGLTDMNIVGHQYTWERGGGSEDWTEVRLDRALTNSSWLELFPLAKLYNLEGSTSDHSPLLLVPHQKPTNSCQRRFRFKNAWLTEPMCAQLTRDVWESSIGWDIQSKIKKCGDQLLAWGKDLTGNFRIRIKKCKDEMKLLRGKRNLTAQHRYNDAKK